MLFYSVILGLMVTMISLISIASPCLSANVRLSYYAALRSTTP